MKSNARSELTHLKAVLRELFPGKEHSYTRMSLFRTARSTARHPTSGVGSVMHDMSFMAPPKAIEPLKKNAVATAIEEALNKDLGCAQCQEHIEALEQIASICEEHWKDPPKVSCHCPGCPKQVASVVGVRHVLRVRKRRL
jgi:hypothetical protein